MLFSLPENKKGPGVFPLAGPLQINAKDAKGAKFVFLCDLRELCVSSS